MTCTQQLIRDWTTELIRTVGVPAAICGFVLYWGSDQMGRLAEDAREDRAYIRATLTQLVADSNKQNAMSAEALLHATEAITETRIVLERMQEAMDNHRSINR